MNRKLTNAIRFVMDELLPPAIRDNKYFMYPFFYIWFKGQGLDMAMNFKSKVYSFTEEDYEELYKTQVSLARDRVTDLNEPSIKFMLENLDPEAKTIIDIGCGNGYWLSRIDRSKYEIAACDIKNNLKHVDCPFHEGNLEHLPFEDNAFDIVTCHHTLEHVMDLPKSIRELKRVAKRQVVIVVPKQRYFYYTLDQHINFFPFKEVLEHTVGIEKHTCTKVWGDWVYIGYPKDSDLDK
ncbi:class I SAM-dependent methyltransferase [Hyphobacterium sp. CCMP332]|nr:class I SAM-dependent methyltransferase [Hyphobacterium sp. CCMP332]